MNKKRQEIILNHPKKFDALAYDLHHKKGLCIFEIENTWRVLSWWNEHDCIHQLPIDLPSPLPSTLPFFGGWVGMIHYPLPEPKTFFWKTDGAICFHIPTKSYHITGTKDFCMEAQYSLKKKSLSPPSRKSVSIPPVHERDKNRFCHQVMLLKKAIHDGMVYQANLSRKSPIFEIHDPLLNYLHIQKNNQARFGAYLQFDETQVISNSPELFLQADGLTNVRLHSQPIKGTRTRNKRTELWYNKKERAELTMIADLVRNDLGRVATIGSVFTKNRSLRRCGDLLHAEQSIYAHLSPEKNIIQAIQAIFPAGSITGAPKKSAMRYISELEEYPRGLYTGSIGFICDQHHCHFNVAIRTIFISQKQAQFHVGCGIVHNSQPQQEWEESIAKGNALSKLLFT